MTDKPAKNTAASVRRRLLDLRTCRNEDYNAILMQYAIERFLYRLSKSAVADRFMLKGAMLFRAWAGQLPRPTKDLDLLGDGEATPVAVVQTIHQVLTTSVPDDGLTFDTGDFTATEIREEQEYGGIRIKLAAMLGNARIPMQIDVGFGDAVTPPPVVQTYPTLLGTDAPKVRMYPPETVIAEKLETAIVRGMINSRMKDYYDLLVIFRVHKRDDETLARAIATTFKRRGTALPAKVPPGLSDSFGTNPTAQHIWRAFLHRLQLDDAPPDFSVVIHQVRERLWPAIRQARQVGK